MDKQKKALNTEPGIGDIVAMRKGGSAKRRLLLLIILGIIAVCFFALLTFKLANRSNESSKTTSGGTPKGMLKLDPPKATEPYDINKADQKGALGGM